MAFPCPALSRPLLLLAAMFVPSALTAATVFPGPATKHAAVHHSYLGFDANDYPGDAQLPALRQRFAFTGYWLNNAPGATSNPWAGKRDTLLHAGFGFLVLFNGRLDTELLAAQHSGQSPATLARADAALAITAARREGFPPHTILFLDQEDGGRMLPEQSAYILGWTEAVAASAYRPGVYASGQPVPDGTGPNGKPVTITTIQDLREHVTAAHLHPIDFFAYNDTCPPAPGCVVPSANPPSTDLSGTLDLSAWQYAQSPRRPENTRACAATYNRDNQCYAPGIPNIALDLSVSSSPDPSHGR